MFSNKSTQINHFVENEIQGFTLEVLKLFLLAVGMQLNNLKLPVYRRLVAF